MRKLHNFYRLPFIAAILIIIFSSSFSLGIYSLFDQKRILQCFVLLLGSAAFLTLFCRVKFIGLGKEVKILSLLLLVLLVISSILAPLPGWAFLQIGWYILIIQLTFLCAFLYVESRDQYLNHLLIGLILFCVLYSTRVYADYIVGIFRDDWTTWPQQRNIVMMMDGVNIYPSGFLGFANERFFNHLQTWSLPLLVFGYTHFKGKLIPGIRYLLLFFISTWWMLVFASDARGTMLASLLSVLIVLYLFRKRCVGLLKPYGTTALAGFVLYLILFLALKSGGAKEAFTRFHDSGRIELWLFSIQEIFNNPIFGLGPMHFTHLYTGAPKPTPHNLILQTTVEWGIPAALIVGSIIFIGIFKFLNQSVLIVKESKSDRTNLRIAINASILAALTHSMVSGINNSQLSQLLGAIIVGLAIGEYYLNSQKRLYVMREKINLGFIILSSLLIINMSYIGYKVISDIPRLDERKNHYLKNHNAIQLFPRFWNQGVIYDLENHTNTNRTQEN